MDQLHRMSAYFNEREKKRLEAKTKEATGGVPEMSVRCYIVSLNIAYI